MGTHDKKPHAKVLGSIDFWLTEPCAPKNFTRLTATGLLKIGTVDKFVDSEFESSDYSRQQRNGYEMVFAEISIAMVYIGDNGAKFRKVFGKVDRAAEMLMEELDYFKQ